MQQGIWITWEKQRRNQGIASELNFALYEIIYKKPRLIRYLMSSIKTIRIIVHKKPSCLVVQNPSLVLAALAVLLRCIFKYRLIVDSHNSGIFPLEARSKILMILSKLIQKRAELTIVTNEKLKTEVMSNGGNPFVLPDKIPDVPSIISRLQLSNDNINVACICTFSEDEPYYNIMNAASLVSSDIIIYVTGKYYGKVNIDDIPKNVRLLGFIPEHTYWSLLLASDIIIDLTLRQDCLVCGAYEAIAVEKPLILSNTEVTTFYFNKGCIYVNPNESKSIAYGIDLAIKNYGVLKKDILDLKQQLNRKWNDQILSLKQLLSQDQTAKSIRQFMA